MKVLALIAFIFSSVFLAATQNPVGNLALWIGLAAGAIMVEKTPKEKQK